MGKKKNLKETIIKELEINEYYQYDNRVYFKTLSGYLVSLPKNQYFEKKRRLTDYFSDRPEAEKKRLIKENLAIGSIPLPDKEYHPKIEIVYQSNAVVTWKISDYSPDDDFKNFYPFGKLTDLRNDDEIVPQDQDWNSAYPRTAWVTDFARRLRNKLRAGVI